MQLIGVADRQDLDDAHMSPGLDILEMLASSGAVVAYHDPHVPCLPPVYCRPHLGGESVPLTAELLGGQDAVGVVADLADFDWSWVARHARLIVDGGDATRAADTGLCRVVHA